MSNSQIPNKYYLDSIQHIDDNINSPVVSQTEAQQSYTQSIKRIHLLFSYLLRLAWKYTDIKQLKAIHGYIEDAYLYRIDVGVFDCEG